MKYKWFQNAEVREKICNRIIQLYGTAGKYDERTLANLIYVLGKTGLTADFIPKDVIQVLESSIIKCADSFISQHISNIFYGYE
jgi:ADP-dependent phosphofructokinase/glucokinase